MANTIKLKQGSGSDPSASDLVLGEPAIRTDTGEIFLKKDDGSIAKVAGGIEDGDKGDIVVSNSGTTFLIDSGVIDNANVASNAAIAGSKINPSFGNQGVTSTNSITLDGSVGDTIIKASGAEIEFTRGASNNITCSDNSGSLNINTAGSTRMNIGSNGNVGIATTSAGGKLAILSNSSTYEGLELQTPSGDGSGEFHIGVHQSGATSGRSIVFKRGGSDGMDSESCRIDNSGNFVVGGTSAQASDAATLMADGEVTAAGFYFSNNIGSAMNSEGIRRKTTNTIAFDTNSTERMTLNNSGLDVTGTITASGLAQFNDDVQFSSPSDNNALTWDKSEFTLEWRDNVKAAYGDNDDLLIYHSGSHSIVNNSTGDLRIESDRIELLNNASNEFYLTADANGAVELYHDNAARIGTTSYGVNIIGDARFGDNRKATFGNNGTDLLIYYDGASDSIIQGGSPTVIRSNLLLLKNYDNSESYIRCTNNGNVEIFHDNTKRIETTSTGASITGNAIIDAVKVGAWSGGSTYKGIFHNSQSSSEYIIMNNDSHTFISTSSGGSVYIRTGGNDSTNQLIVSNGSNGLTWRGNKVFHAGNDGAGSGLDADSVDGIAGSSFLRSDATDSASGALTFTGGLTTNLTSISNGILELKAAITTSHTLTADYNAIAVDPTINNGITVTVPSGAVWAIV